MNTVYYTLLTQLCQLCITQSSQIIAQYTAHRNPGSFCPEVMFCTHSAQVQATSQRLNVKAFPDLFATLFSYFIFLKLVAHSWFTLVMKTLIALMNDGFQVTISKSEVQMTSNFFFPGLQ